MGETMSDDKLCPFIKEQWSFPARDSMRFEGTDTLGPCLREKCQMWRTDWEYDSTRGYDVARATYCGLAGKP
jgi:hypothetical protein